MGQSKLYISETNDIGHNDYLPITSIVPNQILKTHASRNSVSRFFQRMFNKSNISPDQETVYSNTAPSLKNVSNQEVQEKKLLLNLESCVNAARSAEGGEQYDWD